MDGPGLGIWLGSDEAGGDGVGGLAGGVAVDGASLFVTVRGGGVGSNHPPISGIAMTAITARTSSTSTARNQPVAKMLR